MKTLIHRSAPRPRLRRFVPALLCLLAAPLAAEPSVEILPITVFRNLEAGGKQTVVTYGTSLTDKGAWAGEVRKYFDLHYPGQVEFHNTAKSGMHSDWGKENLPDRVLAHHPDLVFLEFSANDAATKHGISTARSEANLDAMVRALRQQNPDVDIILQTMNPAWDSPKSAPKRYAGDRPHLDDYYAVYRDYARRHGLPLVDHFPVWDEIRNNEPGRFRKMVSDGIHPHSGPSREVTWKAVAEMLERARVAAGGPVGLRDGDTHPVWPGGGMPGKGARDQEANRSPERLDALRITNVSTPTLTLFPAPDRGAPAPAAIICPGGGYSYVVIDKEGSEIAAWLNSLGFTGIVLKYRTPNNRAGAFQDTQRAIRVARANASEWNIDPKKLGIIGFSAGGNLAAKAATLSAKPSYATVDEADRQSCRPDFAILVYPAYLDDRNDGLSPDLDPTADIPPTLIVHSDDDERFIPGSTLYDAALTRAGKPHQFLRYATGGHGYGLHCELEAKDWPDDAAAWLEKSGFGKSNVAPHPPAR